jgi:hypothetical protein
MRSPTASETLVLAPPREHAALDRARVAVAGQGTKQETSQPDHRRAARGVLIGIFLGAGAWGVILAIASALWHRG